MAKKICSLRKSKEQPSCFYGKLDDGRMLQICYTYRGNSKQPLFNAYVSKESEQLELPFEEYKHINRDLFM